MARPNDIRINIGFLRHVKTKKLRRELGSDGVLSLIALWLWAAEYKPDGVLNGVGPEELEDEVGWKGEQGAFHRALLDIGFLEKLSTGGIVIHDWAIHNGWAANAEKRSEIARNASKMRWGMRGASVKGNPNSIAGSNSESNAPSNRPSPSPSPYPSLQASAPPVGVASRPDPVRDHQPTKRDKVCHIPACGNPASYWQGTRGACRDHADTIG